MAVNHIAKYVPKQVGEVTNTPEPFITDQVKSIANQVFAKLAMIKSGWRAGFKTQSEVAGYKEQLLLAMHENGINSMEHIELGLKNARLDPSPFMPSTGQFISWCKPPAQEGELNKAMYRIYDPKLRVASCTEAERKEAAKIGLAEIKNLIGAHNGNK